jgi:ketosteroid isomerase-like protein
VLDTGPLVGGDQGEIARAAYAAFNDGDVEGVLALADPDIEIRDPDRTGDVFRGHDGYRRFITDWLETFDEYRIEIVDVVVNGDRVFVDAVAHGRGKGSGLELSQGFNQVLTIRDGKIAIFEVFTDRADAERAAGLRD